MLCKTLLPDTFTIPLAFCASDIDGLAGDALLGDVSLAGDTLLLGDGSWVLWVGAYWAL